LDETKTKTSTNKAAIIWRNKAILWSSLGRKQNSRLRQGKVILLWN